MLLAEIISTIDWTTIAIFAGVLLLSIKLFSRPRNLPPGPPRWPVIGNLLLLLKTNNKLPECIGDLKKKYGPVISMNILGREVIFLTDYDVIKEAFVKRSEQFGFRAPAFNVTRKIFKNNGIIAANGHRWLKSRRFALQNLRDFGVGKNTIESTIQEEIALLQQELASYEGKPTNIRGLLLHAASNIICSVIFEKRTAYSDEDFRSLVGNLNKSLNNIHMLHPANILPGGTTIFPNAKRLVDAFAVMDEFTDEQIEEHLQSYDPNETRDFVDIYLHCEKGSEGEEDNHLTRENMKGIIRDLFVAGTDTSSTTIYWAMLYMIAYPDMQKKCKDEILKVIGNGKMVKYSDRNELHYVQGTLAEVQRLSTILPFSLSHRAIVETVLCGYTIPKDATIRGSLYQVHYDKEIWGEDADTIRPERWLNKEGHFMKNEKLVPFSIGSRMCLGEQLAKMEVFMIFVGLLQHLTFTKRSPEFVLDLGGYTGTFRSPKDYEICAND